MNKIWTFLILISFIYALFTNNTTLLINSLFDVPELSIKLLISIGSLIIIYNGIFQITIDSGLIKKISFLFKPVIKLIYKTNNEDLLDLLCANFTANLLGIGIASTPIALKAVKIIDNEKIYNKLVCMNVACFNIFPITIITLREKYNGINNTKVWLCIVFITFSTTLFGIFLCNLGKNK